MMPRPTVAVLMTCHNRRDTTVACLEHLAAQITQADLHLIVYDDGCIDGTAASVRQYWPAAQILRGSGSAYWSGGMRAAFSHALEQGFDFYLWLNDDVMLAPDAVARLLATHEEIRRRQHRTILIGGAVAVPGSDRATYCGLTLRGGLNPLQVDFCPPSPIAIRRCDTLNGNLVLVPHGTAAQIGSVGEPYIQSLGDLDYGLRVTRAGGWVGLAAGFLGTCSPNTVVGRWFNPALPLGARWALVNQPLGFPLRPWLHFARTHGGPLWPAFVPWPYWRLFVPPRVTLALHRRLRRRTGDRVEASHAS